MSTVVEIINKIVNNEKSISSSALKEAKSSTREFLSYYSKPKDKKSYFDFGNALELWMIDKNAFKEQVAVMDESKRPAPDKDYKTTANKDWKAQFYAENEDKYIIPSGGKESFATIMELEMLAKKHSHYDMLVSKRFNYQDPFEWICPISGFKRYSRTDLFSAEDEIIIDIKTDGDGDFIKSCTNNDYWLQAYDQIQGAILSGKMKDVKTYYWFVFTKKEPYFFDVFEFNFSEALRVDEAYRSTLLRLKEDLHSGEAQDIVWHDMPVVTAKLPNWYK